MQDLLREGRIFRKKGYYYNFLLTDEELRVICDSILFAKQLPVDIVRSIFKKLIPETSPRRKSYLMNVEYLVNITRSENPFLYEVLEQIDLAIRQNRKVIVYPCTLIIDKGFDYFEEYLIDPFYIVTDKNRYYLLGGCDKHGIQIEPRRIDRIAKVKITDKPRKPFDYYWDEPYPFDIVRYLQEHIYMFPGKSVPIRMEIVQRRIGDFIDWFISCRLCNLCRLRLFPFDR